MQDHNGGAQYRRTGKTREDRRIIVLDNAPMAPYFGT
jgi:hypothetical protein